MGSAANKDEVRGERVLQNRMLGRLLQHELSALGPLARLELRAKDRLEEPGEPPGHIYFIETGVAVVAGPDDLNLDAGLSVIGNEGMTGTCFLYDDPSPVFQTLMLTEGAAYRAEAAKLSDLIAKNRDLQTVARQFTRALSIQAQETALANAKFVLSQRLARWLLHIDDRCSRHFRVTHGQLAWLLGVRRSGVTTALHALESQLLIDNSNRTVRVVNRAGLLKAAGGSYGLAHRHYLRLFGQGDFNSSGGMAR